MTALPEPAGAGRRRRLSAPLRRLGARLRPKLLTRVALALAAVGLLPVAIASFGLVDINREAMEEQVLRTHILAAQTAASRVAAFLDTRTALAHGLASSAALADPRSPAAQELLGREIRALSDLGVLAIAVVNARGEEVVRAQLADPAAKRRAQAAFALPAAGAVAVAPGALPPMLRVEAPLAAGGAVRLACDASALDDIVVPDEIGDQADLVLARPGDQAALAARARSPVQVIGGSLRSVATFPANMVESALSGHLRGAGRYAGPRGELVLGAYAPVAGSDWAVLSRQPSRVADAVARRVRRQAALALGAALLLIAALSGLAYASLVRPIRQLAGGGIGGVIGNDKSSIGDEIDALRNTFAALRRGLVDRQALADVFLGRYQVIEFLAAGGMGTIFRGWDPKLRRAVALKTVRLGDDSLADQRSRLIASLMHEAVAGARVLHPNVVAVYDVEDAPEGAFIAMEFVDGVNLERLLWQRHRLSPAQVIPLGAGIARGLAAAHELGIVHSDVKPSNVLLGRDGAIKVTDFGIAGLIAAVAAQPGAVFGTPGFVPPESLMGSGYGPPGDLFALGAVLYECLTGTRPFVGKDVTEVMRATLSREIPPIERRAPEAPPELAALVMRLLSHQPADRPAAARVALELDRLAAERNLRWSLGVLPPEAPPSSWTSFELQWMPTLTGTLPTLVQE
jgi:serine/threonine-protein kinase